MKVKYKKRYSASLLFILLLFSAPLTHALDASADALLARFQAARAGSYTIADIRGVAFVRAAGETVFTQITKTPHRIDVGDTIFTYPLASVEIELDPSTHLIINGEGSASLRELFSRQKIAATAFRAMPAGVTALVVRPLPPSIYEKMLAAPGVTEIDVIEGKVWVTELDRYGERTKKEILLAAGESMTTTTSATTTEGGDSSSPPSTPPSPTPSPERPPDTAETAWPVTYVAVKSVNSNTDDARSVVADEGGNIIITGLITNADEDILTVKYDSKLNEVWSVTYDSGGDDCGNAVAIGKDGSIFVAGNITPPATLSTDVILIKYDTNGNMVAGWPKTYDTGGLDSGDAVTLDGPGNIFVAGESGPGPTDFLTLKYDPSGTLLWAKTYDSGTDDQASDCVIDSDGNVISIGLTQYVFNVSGIATSVKYASSDGAQQWVSTIGYGTKEGVASLGLDSKNRVSLAGLSVPFGTWVVRLNSATGTPSASFTNFADNTSFTCVCFGPNDAVLVGGDGGGIDYDINKYDAAGKFIWRTAYSMAGTTSPNSITTDFNNNIIMTGHSYNGTDYKLITIKLTPPAGSTLTKSVNRKEAVIGDILTYSISIHNPKPGVMSNVVLQDRLPPGFTYVKGSSVYAGSKIRDPIGTRTLTYDLGTFAANAQKTLSYQLIVGAGCIPGEYYNEATATGTFGGTYTFNTTHAIVKVVLDPILQKGTIVGTVYWDHNENGIQEKGEEGIQGVKVYLEDGTSVATDKYGRYHFQGVNPGTHTVKIDKSTIKERL